MVFADLSYIDMLKRIGFRGYARQDFISPDRNPELFDAFDGEFSFGERHVYPNAKYVKEILDQIPCSQRDREYLGQLIAESVQNAFEWGNKRAGHLPILIEVATGKKGSALRISDTGKGHDYKTRTSQRGGTATRLMELTDIEVAPEKGSINFKIMHEN